MHETLSDYLRSSFGRRYRPGLHDCITFISRWADMLAGSSHTLSLAATYKTKFEGLKKHVVARGASDINSAIIARLLESGWERVGDDDPPEIGDIILTDLDHPGIWHGKTIVAQIVGAAGHAYLHHRHRKECFRWVK